MNLIPRSGPVSTACGSSVQLPGMLIIPQWRNKPLTASGSSTINAKLSVPSGVPVHFSGGNRFSPKRVYFCGIGWPSANTGLIRLKVISCLLPCTSKCRSNLCRSGGTHGAAATETRARGIAHRRLLARIGEPRAATCVPEGGRRRKSGPRGRRPIKRIKFRRTTGTLMLVIVLMEGTSAASGPVAVNTFPGT